MSSVSGMPVREMISSEGLSSLPRAVPVGDNMEQSPFRDVVRNQAGSLLGAPCEPVQFAYAGVPQALMRATPSWRAGDMEAVFNRQAYLENSQFWRAGYCQILEENSQLKRIIMGLQQRVARDTGGIMLPQSSSTTPQSAKSGRYWTPQEHEAFLKGVQMFGKRDVKSIAGLVGSRTATQVRTHAQKHFLKHQRQTSAKGVSNECPKAFSQHSLSDSEYACSPVSSASDSHEDRSEWISGQCARVHFEQAIQGQPLAVPFLSYFLPSVTLPSLDAL